MHKSKLLGVSIAIGGLVLEISSFKRALLAKIQAIAFRIKNEICFKDLDVPIKSIFERLVSASYIFICLLSI
jgi:hypothetical protein